MTDTPSALPGRAVIALDGPDTIALLERLVTCNTQNWSAGEARLGALLTPQGKIIAEFIARRTEAGALLDAHEAVAADLAKRLKLFRLRAKVEIEERPDLAAAIAPEDEGFADPRSRSLPRRAIHAGDGLAEADLDAYHAARIAAGVPEQGADYGASEVFPADVNLDLLGGVDFKKGCFVGQEVVSRMKRRGSARRRTLVVRGEGLACGADLLGDGKPIGQITSAAGGLALARVRIDRLAAAGDLTVDNAPVQIDRPAWLDAEMKALSADA